MKIPDRVRVVGLSGHTNGRELSRAAAEFPEARVVNSSEADGEERLVELATMEEVDLVLVAILGVAGLRPALAALEAGKDLAVASKEILVMAGQEVLKVSARSGGKVIPVDSEHSAIFQCLEGSSRENVRRIILTCSGGPFRDATWDKIECASPEQALRHPTWAMGRKISVDSATLFNKGLEMIEARWLFDVPISAVEVVIHPQSVIHSMVEFVDCSVLAQMSHTDMCFPIQYAFTWPDRVAGGLEPLDFTKLVSLEFKQPRNEIFPALRLAREACEAGGTAPAVLNAVNEVAVAAFLERRLKFPGIWQAVEAALEATAVLENPTLEELIQADREARRWTEQWLRRNASKL